jgi:hypothetical protein
MILLSGLGLPVSGIANHVYGFSSFSATRHAWMFAHNILGVLFVVFSIWHIMLNRRALSNYFRIIIHHVSPIRREATLAGAIIIMALLMAAGHAIHMGG